MIQGRRRKQLQGDLKKTGSYFSVIQLAPQPLRRLKLPAPYLGRFKNRISATTSPVKDALRHLSIALSALYLFQLHNSERKNSQYLHGLRDTSRKGGKFFRNVGYRQPLYSVYQPRRPESSTSTLRQPPVLHVFISTSQAVQMDASHVGPIQRMQS